jgi:hypothetical protein
MKDIKHTPGAWIFMTDDTFYGEIRDADNFTLIAVMPELDDRPEDFTLIAAAPDLLAACEYNDLNLFNRDQDMLDSIADVLEDRGILLGIVEALREKARMEKTAIAKAKGERDEHSIATRWAMC